MKKEVKHNNKNIMIGEGYYGILSAVIVCLILLVSLAYRQMIFGENVFIKGDLFEQCAPFAHLFVAKLCDGSNLYYSFKAGLGMNTSLLFAFYVFSPFNILYLFSNGNNINEIAIAVFVLKAGLAAFSFQLFSKCNIKVSNVSSVIFAIGYALASYGICIVDMTTLYDGIYLLPLILVAIKTLIDKKRTIWLVILYTVLFVSNFYSGYIVGMASFCYFIVCLALMKDINEKKWIILYRYIRSVICAFLLGSFILAPALYEAINQNVIDNGYNFEIVHIWNMISSLFPFHEFVMYSTVPYLYCGIPALLLIGGYFTNKKIIRRYKVIVAVSLILIALTMCVECLYSFAHMFNDPTGFTYRYVYILSFVICSMGVMTLKEVDGIQIKKTFVIDAILVLIYYSSPFMNDKIGGRNNPIDSKYYYATIVLVLAWMAILWCYIYNRRSVQGLKILKTKEVAIVALFLFVIEIGVNTYILIQPGTYQNREEYNYRIAQADLLTESVLENDDSVYRIHYDGLANLNLSCLYDYYGSTLYASSGNKRLKDFLYSIGLSCTDFSIYENGTTDLSRLLLDEKYNLGAHMYYKEGLENYIEKNSTAGFGFMVSEKAKDDFINSNVFENQNAVYSALYGEDYNPFLIYADEILLDGRDVYIGMDDDCNIVFALVDGANNGYLSIEAPCIEGYDMYSWVSSGDNFVNSSSPIIQSVDVYEECDYLDHLLTMPQIIRMSKVDDSNEIKIWLADSTENVGYISDYQFAYYNNSYIEPLVEKLSKQSFNITSFEDGHVEGNITAAESGICFMSIPYEEGWTALVDGEPHEITPLFNEAFIGVPLESGYHEIELEFNAPYSKLGQLLSLGGLILFALIVINEKNVNEKNMNQHK